LFSVGRFILVLELASAASVTLSTAGAAEASPSHSSQGATDTTEKAVVRIAVEERSHSGVGAIVTPEGHVVLHEAAHLHDQKLIVFLADGRRASAVLLGWSSEWDISVAQITDKGPWPFVQLAVNPKSPQVNDDCHTIGYTLKESGWTTVPEKRSGRVLDMETPRWFISSIHGNSAEEPFFDFGAVFDVEGKFLGSTPSFSY
jgi:S1-C subfamily serine protease